MFVVDVKFRRNATWQGTVKWEGKEANFRSTLELLKIMDAALEQAHPEDKAELEEKTNSSISLWGESVG